MITIPSKAEVQAERTAKSLSAFEKEVRFFTSGIVRAMCKGENACSFSNCATLHAVETRLKSEFAAKGWVLNLTHNFYSINVEWN